MTGPDARSAKDPAFFVVKLFFTLLDQKNYIFKIKLIYSLIENVSQLGDCND
jgi:hypothetical protein